MKKLILATGLYPPQIGGHAKYAEALHVQLVARGIEAPVVAFGTLKHLPSLVRHTVYLWRVYTQTHGAQAVLAFDTWSVGLPALIAARWRGVPLVVRVGGDFLWESYIERGGEIVSLPQFYDTPQQLTYKERIIRRGTQWLTRRAAKLIFNSTWQRDIWCKAYQIPLERTAIVENEYAGFVGVEPAHNKVFVAAGRATRLKNIPTLERALEAVKNDYPDVALDMQALPMDKHTERLRSCYATVVPSVSDVNPNMIWEALKFGKPFICTVNSGIVERLKGLGIFVDTTNQQALEEALKELLNPERYTSYVQRISEFSYTHTWGDIVDEILAAIPARP